MLYSLALRAKFLMEKPSLSVYAQHSRRAIARVVSSSFLQWPPVTVILGAAIGRRRRARVDEEDQVGVRIGTDILCVLLSRVR